MTIRSNFNTQANVIRFLQDLQNWIDEGCPESPIFSKYIGICRTHRRWSQVHLTLTWGELDELDERLDYLRNLWQDPYRPNSQDFPFNEGLVGYDIERYDESIYKNPRRLEFIKKFSNPANHPKLKKENPI